MLAPSCAAAMQRQQLDYHICRLLKDGGRSAIGGRERPVAELVIVVFDERR
jgi:hypothetical protein